MLRWFVLLLVFLAAPLWAVTPDEVLDDPALEKRAREISQKLRCLVCRNESIDESNAEFARDLRLLVRERVTAGDSNEEALDFVVARFGEYVLLKPPATGSTLLLWALAPAAFLTALAAAGLYIRRRGTAGPADTLTEAESARLREILDD